MELEEAIQRYGIPVPEDIFSYDKNKYIEFHQLYLGSLYKTFAAHSGAGQMIKPIAVVLAGQIGAGKSSLVAKTKKEFKEAGEDIILIEGDEYRNLHPHSKELIENCPEHYTTITSMAVSLITPMILKYATDNRYNFIFGGTMKNRRIINTMTMWEDYTIQVKAMATSRLRSILSVAIRNAELRKKGEGRFATIDIHDETYFGVPETLKYLEKTGLASEIQIYTRGIDIFLPTQQFSSLTANGKSAGDRLEELRGEDEIKFLNEAPEVIEYLKKLLPVLSEEERAEAIKIVKMVEKTRREKGFNSDGR